MVREKRKTKLKAKYIVPRPKFQQGGVLLDLVAKEKIKDKKKRVKERSILYTYHQCYTFNNLHGGNFHNEFP
jgi:hypothetical protein